MAGSLLLNEWMEDDTDLSWLKFMLLCRIAAIVWCACMHVCVCVCVRACMCEV